MFTRRRILLAFLGVVLGGMGWMVWYVCTKGFTRSWRQLIAAEFEKQGMEIYLRRLTLDPLRGLVAEEVRLLDARDRRRVLATVDEMELGVNYAGALRGEGFLDSVDLRDAHISIPLDSARPESATIEVSKLNARLFFPPQQIYVARAEAEVLGVQVYASGRIINPQSYRAGERDRAMVQQLAAVVEMLGSLKYRGEAPPVLRLEFSGDVEKPQEMAADARFDAEGVKRKNYSMSRVNAVASFRNGILELHRVGAADGKGELRGSCTYQPGTGRISARVQSGMAMHDLWRAYVSETLPVALSLSTPPKLDLSLEGVVARRDAWNVFGHVELERFSFREAPFRALTTDVSWSGGRWSLRDMHLQHQSGEMRGDAVVVPGDFRAALQGRIDPRAFATLYPAALTEWLGRFDFVDSPTVELELRGRAPTLKECSATGKVQFGRALYDGAPAQNFTTSLRFGDGRLSLFPFREAGEELIFDLPKKEARVEKRGTGAVGAGLKNLANE